MSDNPVHVRDPLTGSRGRIVCMGQITVGNLPEQYVSEIQKKPEVLHGKREMKRRGWEPAVGKVKRRPQRHNARTPFKCILYYRLNFTTDYP